MNVQPAQYHRQSKDWHKLIGQTGIVEFSTQLFVASPELEQFLPYCFLIVVLDSGKKIEVMGEAKTKFATGDKIILELRKMAVLDPASIIPYTIKAVKVLV